MKKTNKLERENRRLLKTVQKSKLELAAKNRQLEIEASLERVRSVAMGMKKREDMLQICKTITHQLAKLGLKDIRNVQTAIFYESKGVYMNYEFYAKHNKTIITETSYTNHKIHKAFAQKMLKGKGQFYKTHIKGIKVKDWIKYQKTTNVFIDKYLKTASSLNYYWHSLGPVALGISTYKPLSKKNSDLFLRFLKDFELAYHRYLDIEKAETQAREAQIEAALERVRSKAMAMQHSQELGGLVSTLFSELNKLDFSLTSCIIWIHDEDKDALWITSAENRGSARPYLITPFHKGFFSSIFHAWKGRDKKWFYTLKGKAKENFQKAFFKAMPGLSDGLRKALRNPSEVVFSASFNKFGALEIVETEPLTDEKFEILHRFGKVFNTSYTRFHDLKKAEAQAREAEIELALERVRARTMAMQKSEELPETSYILFQQMKELGEPAEQLTIGVVHEENNVIEISATVQGEMLKKIYLHSIDEPLMMSKIYKAWKNQQKTLVVEMKGNELNAYNKYRNELTKSNMFPTDLRNDQRRIVYAAFFSKGMLALAANAPRPQSLELLERFASVFDLTYTRFLDLQKAEAQAREAQIEASLERVRSRTMGMQKSEELKEVIQLVYNQLVHLNIDVEHAGFLIDYKERDDLHIWLADQHEIPSEIIIPCFDSPPNNSIKEAKERGQDFFSYQLSFEEKNKFYLDLFKFIPGVPEETKGYYQDYPGLAGSGVLLENIGLYIENFTGSAYTDEENAMLMRFGKVFQQTYTRFLDLQKAEAQTRETQIQLALERVRARTMAMLNSEELGEVATVMFVELNKLLTNLWTCGFVLCERDREEDEWWLTSESGFIPAFYLPNIGDITHNNIYQGWLRGEIYHTEQLEGKALQKHYDWLMSIPVSKKIFEEMEAAGFEKPEWQKLHCAYFSKGYLCIITREPCAEEVIFERFAKAFDLTYTRFLDLKKAEAQAREAQIQLALERARAQSMMMQHSKELDDTLRVFHEQILQLGIRSAFSFLWLPDEENDRHIFWAVWAENNSTVFKSKAINYPLDRNEPATAQCLVDWKTKQIVSYQVPPEGVESYFGAWNELIEGVEHLKPDYFREGLFYVEAFIKYGCFGVLVKNDLAEDEKKILYRFAVEFERTYTRFLDLQKAETQAREAQIETALEKVRSRTLAMQKSEELSGTAAVLFQQLIALGIAPNRLYIILTKEDSSGMEAWVTDEDGSKVSMGFTGDHQKNNSLKKMYDGWRQQKKNLVIDMQGEELQEYFHYLHDELKVPFKGGLEQKRRIQYLAYFSHGLIGMASPDEQPAETLQLMERFASVFNLTFTRFNDLKIAEAHALQAEQDLISIREAKHKAEEALTELQATQKQLIQSEKMASLGELTAGIAHEIQNPLNFVNNFSEVSKELLDEMREAIEKGDTEDAKDIMNDVIQNLEKINHHGKRADGIVKGMLQHSRSSSGTKELTNINALADEYLRLAYHGLRAKDKSFNAVMKTDFDESLPLVNVIPQDIGRVILNLITNAFYAVTEKKRSGVAGYEPTVTISSKKGGDRIEICVTDNGNGIPTSVKEKIFQPFFTTKPTGQGTGLGLSLSYDIIKAHGGEIKMESKEGEGTNFFIQLMVNE